MIVAGSYGACDICGSDILYPGLEAYFCSSRKCGEKIILRNAKTKKIKSEHPPNGWVKRESIPRILERKAKTEERERKKRKALKDKEAKI